MIKKKIISSTRDPEFESLKLPPHSLDYEVACCRHLPDAHQVMSGLVAFENARRPFEPVGDFKREHAEPTVDLGKEHTRGWDLIP